MHTIAEFLHTNHKSLREINEKSFKEKDIFFSNVVIMLAIVDAIEKIIGKVKITSGYRCAELNMEVGGVKNSKHTQAKAVDIVPLHTDLDKAMHLIGATNIKKQYNIEDIIREASWIHIEIK